VLQLHRAGLTGSIGESERPATTRRRNPPSRSYRRTCSTPVVPGRPGSSYDSWSSPGSSELSPPTVRPRPI